VIVQSVTSSCITVDHCLSQSHAAFDVADVITDHEPLVKASAGGTGEPHGDVVGALDEVPAGCGVLVDTVSQTLVLTQVHQI